MGVTAFAYIQIREIDYFAQAATIIESRASNARHALGDVDGGEAAAIIESITLYGSYGIGNGQFCYKFAVQV